MKRLLNLKFNFRTCLLLLSNAGVCLRGVSLLLLLTSFGLPACQANAEGMYSAIPEKKISLASSPQEGYSGGDSSNFSNIDKNLLEKLRKLR